MSNRPLLQIRDLHVHYGGVVALRGVSLHVNAGEIVTLIGANGAGKSTLLMSICGQPQASEGRIHYDEQEITDTPTHLIMQRGIAHAPEGRRIFQRMTVMENLRLGAAQQEHKNNADTLKHVFDLFPALEQRKNQRGGTLSGGEQQMLCIARALMSQPKLLLLDEPSLGLSPKLVKQIFAALSRVNSEEGVTLLLVEQNAYYSLKLAHRGYVLANGQIVASESSWNLLSDPAIRAAYLGAAE